MFLVKFIFKNVPLKILQRFWSQEEVYQNVPILNIWSRRFKIDCAVCTCWNKCRCGRQLVWLEKEANVDLDHVMSRNVDPLRVGQSRLPHVSRTVMRSLTPQSSHETSLSAFRGPLPINPSVRVCVWWEVLEYRSACVQITNEAPKTDMSWRSSSAPQAIRLDRQPLVRFVSLSRARYVKVGFWPKFRPDQRH